MSENNNQKYILVTGGELRNKGAQAMTFITVDQMAKQYPEYKVILFSNGDSKREKKEKDNYKFEIMPFPGFGESLSLCTGLLKRRYLKRENGKYFAQYKNIFQNAVALLDISGYALGSKWNYNTNKGYLRRIRLAKQFNIPVFLMPQSFGPFDFKDKKSRRLNSKIRRQLSKVKVIMARENEGKVLLEEKYGLKNVIKTPDMVLQNKGISVGNIYNNLPKIKEIIIQEESVAIIPNSKNNKFGNDKLIMEFYKEAIRLMLKKGKKIYLIFHAVEDLRICQDIKQTYFAKEEKVYLIEEELSCIDFDNMISKFDFIIGSRFHSIIHAYRKAVPSIVLGWAIKYRELADQFGQIQYCFDCSNIDAHKEEILIKINQMCEMYKKESEKISEGVAKIQKGNVFDLVKIKNKE
ncbi:MAG: polysaccharide pyruvyl transferase family protein [Clostridia bacterium]|nr:polysaccharide pyruvyl transferase family protein [Clostridia bacterium]